VHGATLSRSFAKIGTMSPYAIVRADKFEILQTKAHSGAHKKPVWNECIKRDNVPETIDIAIWDKNNFHKHVFCGSVTIPCFAEEAFLEKQEFVLEKRMASTGTVCVTLKICTRENAEKDHDTLASLFRQNTAHSLGGEFDEIVEAVALRSHSRKGTTLKMQSAVAIPEEAADEEEGQEDDSRPEFGSVVSTPSAKFPAHAIVGNWTCIATEGLEEFMIKSGVGMFQRKIAKAAKWPSWDFAADHDKIVFINHSAIGDIREDIPLEEEYDWKDGKSNPWKCIATWTKHPGGGVLLIERKGSMGNYSEERRITHDELVFILKNPQYDAQWGRTFTRS